MSKTLKGTYLWNKTVSFPDKTFTIKFEHGVKTNYGANTIYGIGVGFSTDGLTLKKIMQIIYPGDFKFKHIDWSGYEDQNCAEVYARTEDTEGKWFGFGAFRSMTFGNGDSGETVTDDFHAWFTANTMLLDDVVELTGTWEWNSAIGGAFMESQWSEDLGATQYYPVFTEELPVFHDDVDAVINTTGIKVQAIRAVAREPFDNGDNDGFASGGSQYFDVFYMGTDIGGTGIDSIQIYDPDPFMYENAEETIYKRWPVKGCRTITFNQGTMVSATFYSWFTSNANSIELCEISGRWKWNSVPTMHTRDFDRVKVNFTSGFSSMDYMFVENDIATATSEITYISPDFERKVYSPYGRAMENLKLTGIWKLNEKLSAPAHLSDQISELVETFESAKLQVPDGSFRELSKIEINVNGILETINFINAHFTDGDSLTIYANNSGGWTNGYSNLERLISFDSDSGETVSDEFYTWFTSNAKQILDELELGWFDYMYGVIDFGTDTQKVTKEFYDWFTANATEYALIEIRGRWRFDMSLSDLDVDIPGIYEPISFKTVTNDKAYLGFAVSKKKENGPLHLEYCTYIKPGEVIEYHHVATSSGTTMWPNGLTDRTIDFGNTPKLVSVQFYNWLESNANSHDYLLYGTLMFKETPSLYTASSSIQEFDPNGLFACNGQIYTRLTVENDDGNLRIQYDDVVAYTNSAWVDDSYRLIVLDGIRSSDNHTSYFYLSDKEYEWFMDNRVDGDYVLVKKTTLVGIADAIRGKTGRTNKIAISDLRREVISIEQSITLDNVVSVSIRET